ncbi:lymphocyte activation gene 3 protein isoform X2 [Python bivittatus]|uniref:Lymphocyte activation gene 3 protein isoform X2 n=1 Tax=Python bivittatus TaxID=176946 RepID=A0A9F5INT7_PYTBI|nr:lymphocyte activation gene 3 protein isoform X2 [Python bivittatus]
MTVVLLFCTTVLILQVTNGEKYRVWGEEGTRVMLPCHLSHQKLKDNLRQLYKGLEVHWVRHGGSASMKRHLVLKVKSSGLKSLGHSMMHRVTVWDTGFLKGNFSLQIEPLLKEDAGTYEACVRHGSEEWHCQLELGVVSGFAEQASSVIYTAVGSDAHLPCVLNSNPMHYGISRMAIRWRYMVGRELKAKPTLSYENHQDFTLHLPAVGLDDVGQYRCEITIQGITIIENVTLAAMAVIPSTVGPRIAEGSHLLLNCNLSYYKGKEHFQWKRLDLQSTNSSQSESVSMRPEILKRGPVLEFPQVSPRDAGIWECSAHGPEGKLGSVQYHLEITASPQIASLPPVPTEIIFGLLLFLLVVLLSIIALIYLRRRMCSLNFQALDRIVDALPEKGEKNGGQQKILQLEC